MVNLGGRGGWRSCAAVLVAVAGLTLVGEARPTGQEARGRQRPVATLRAGAARVDITPTLPVALEGYVDPETRVSEGVHDRIYARAIALSAGSTRLVLVSADLGSFMSAPHFQRVIADRLHLAPSEILLCAIHTHSGPQLSMNADYPHANNATYTRQVAERLVTVVARALGAMEPATLAVGRGTCPVNASRRRPTADGGIEMAPNPDGPVDHDVTALQVRGRSGRTLAVLFTFACHSRSLRRPNRLVSGDILGLAEQAIEGELAGHPVVAAFAGTSADIDPALVVDTFADGATVEQGRQLGGAVLDAVRAARRDDTSSELRILRKTVPLASRSGGAPRRVDLVAASVAGTGLLAFECEASVEIGLAIKAASPFPATLIVTLCNGWGGYLPVAHQYDEGGYEVSHTPYARGAAEALVGEAVALLRQLAPAVRRGQ
jgi:neutral ceramidase